MKESLSSKLSNFSKEVSACNEQVLGSLLFTCAGRIPEAKLKLGSYLPHQVGNVYSTLGKYETELDDVKAFEEVFQNTPIAGFYSNAEIGPIAPSHANKEEVVSWFQQSGSGEEEGSSPSLEATMSLMNSDTYQSQMQGYTAVFGMFLKPTKLQKSVNFLNIDASSSQVLSNYIQERSKPQTKKSIC
jgi:hypothetical protein